MRRVASALLSITLALFTITTRADIFRWDNGQLIPGTEGITPGPGVELSGWNTEPHNLRFAEFKGMNLEAAQFLASWLDDARFAGANLSRAYLSQSRLTNADLTDATIAGAILGDITHAQLASTASYKAKDLQGIGLGNKNLNGWDFSGQNLSDAEFTAKQLLGTNFAGANLTGARLSQARLSNANLTDAIVARAGFNTTTSLGFTHAQLASTASYKAKDLRGMELGGNNFRGWDLEGQDLSGAGLSGTTLTSAILAGANLSGAHLDHSTLTRAKLAGANLSIADLDSTSLMNADLSGANLFRARVTSSALDNANLSGANLSSANLLYSSLTNADLSGANLSSANLSQVPLTNAKLTDAIVAGTSFYNTTSIGFTQAQLASTASYKAKSLQRIGLGANDLTGWDFSGQDLTGASLQFATLTSVNFAAADLRGARIDAGGLANAITENLIRPDGTVVELDLAAGQTLEVRDYDGQLPAGPIPISVRTGASVADGAVLRMVFESDDWGSTIAFEPSIPVHLGGKLDLTLAPNADPAGQVGRTLDLFDWTAVSPTGVFTVSSLYSWDLSRLYTTGEVTLLAAGGAIAGDATGDGQVDLADFGILKDHFGAKGTKAEGDANGDGNVDLSDFGLLKLNLGKSAPVNAAVPEPSTWLLTTLAALGCLVMRRRRK